MSLRGSISVMDPLEGCRGENIALTSPNLAYKSVKVSQEIIIY